MKKIFFWGFDHINGVFSNFYVHPYRSSNGYFQTSEKEFMYLKALFFNDVETAKEIMLSTKPSQAKKLGKKVNNFDAEEWSKVRYEIMKECLRNKFRDLSDILINTGDAILVESSPLDGIWGIGMTEEEARNLPMEDWRGMNLLGKALMEVREELKGEKNG